MEGEDLQPTGLRKYEKEWENICKEFPERIARDYRACYLDFLMMFTAELGTGLVKTLDGEKRKIYWLSSEQTAWIEKI